MSLRKKSIATVLSVATISLVASMVAVVTPANAASAACQAIGAGYLPQQGKTVEIFTSVTGQELQRYVAATANFTACTGIKVNWNGTDTFESTLPVRVKGGNAPDLALVPQPGLIQAMVATGKAVQVPAKVAANVNQYWSKSWRGLGSVNGVLYAAPNSANMKSFVWYSPKNFKTHGYSVPTTWSDMFKLSDQMVKDGLTPWCGGLGSGTATGWPATDWVEEVVVRQSGLQTYNDWISHKVKFSDAPIQSAMTTVANWLQNPKYVGDPKAIATTTFQDAGMSIPAGTGCQMLQQASFYAAQFPKGTVVSPTGDVYAFYLPGINPKVTTPVEGGGEFYLAFNKNPATVELQTYLSTPQWAEARIKAAGADGGWTSANNGVPLTDYTNAIDALSAKYLTAKDSTFVFDASDAMPAAVGAGTEWTAFTDWFAKGTDVKTVAKTIDASWPTN